MGERVVAEVDCVMTANDKVMVMKGRGAKKATYCCVLDAQESLR